VIAISGLSMKFVSHTDVVGVKGFILGMMSFVPLYGNSQPLPEHPGLYVHLILVTVLLMIFPISKLLHAPGLFFSPSRNQADNPREKRHTSAWGKQLEK
jgi:nitrate reductase gamma subunit